MSSLRSGGRTSMTAGRTSMTANDSFLDEAPRQSRLQGMRSSRHGGRSQLGDDSRVSTLANLSTRGPNRGHGPSRHGSRMPGSHSGPSNMGGPEGRGSAMTNGGSDDDDSFTIPPGGYPYPFGKDGFDSRGLHYIHRHAYDEAEKYASFMDDEEARYSQLAVRDGSGRRGAIDEGRLGTGRHGREHIGLSAIDEARTRTGRYGREDSGPSDLDSDLEDRHGASRRHGHRGHRDMDGPEGHGRFRGGR